MSLRISLIFLTLLVSRTIAQTGPSWSATPFNPPSLPLAVRSPYLNTWFKQGNNPSSLTGVWSQTWLDAITGWYASILVDTTGYMILGSADTSVVNVTKATQKSVEFTPTRTSFIMTAGPMDVNLTFISPIEPGDLVRQSMPFSYLSLSATSNDGNSHSIRFYSDISGEFMAGDTTQTAQWAYDDQSGEYVILSMQLQAQQKYTEVNDLAQDSVEYYAVKKLSGATTSWAITEDTVNRKNGAASNVTSLGNVADSTPRAVRNNWPTLGIAVDWGTVSSTPEPVVYAIGVARGPSILYSTPEGTQQDRYPYYLSVYSDGNSAIKAFLDDYDRAASAAAAFDSQITSAASSISSQYAELLALSSRQLMGNLDITISKIGSNDWNTSDIMIFTKNMGGMGSDGGTQTSVNTVDVIYNAFPMLLTLNPELGGYLLAPLMRYMDSTAYTLSYAAMNLGPSYPQATAEGINNAHDYGVEETANMLIMNLAYAQTSGNGTFISRHYTRLRRWADYLVNNTLTPTNQKSPDFGSDSSLSNNNQTNTALKGIIGIGAFAKMAALAGVDSDHESYNDTATSYMRTWQANAVASDNSHVDFFYGKTDTNGLIYNVFANKLLQLNLVPDSVYEILTVFYNNIAAQSNYGISLNNEDAAETSTHAMIFSASFVTNTQTRDYMVNQVHSYASSNRNSTPFTPFYNPTTGYATNSDTAGINSPAIGAMYSLLAINVDIKDSVTIPTEGSTITGGSSTGPKGSNTGAIVGGVVGGLAGLGLIGIGVFLCVRRRRQQEQNEKLLHSDAYSTSYKSTGTGGVPGLANATTFEPFRYNNNPSETRAVSPALFPSPYSDVSARTNSGQHHETPVTPYQTTATNVRDSTYFRSHRPGESGSDIGPSASQVGSALSSGSHGTRSVPRGGREGSQDTTSAMTRADASNASQVLLAKQTLVNEELRCEVDNLRRDLERIREERQANLEEAPPSYSDP